MMKCQRCEATEACISFTQVINGKSVVLHLCERCYIIFQSQIENTERANHIDTQMTMKKMSKEYFRKKYKQSPKQVLEKLKKELRECENKKEFEKVKIIKEIIADLEKDITTLEREN